MALVPGESSGEPWAPLRASAGLDDETWGRIVGLAAGEDHTCALLDAGTVHCWGAGEDGQLGRVESEAIGDDPGEHARSIVLEGDAVAIAAGGAQTCALLEGGEAWCWGDGRDLHLVPLPHAIAAVAVAREHVCVLADGVPWCWGRGEAGRLGLGVEEDVELDELAASGGIALGGAATSLAIADAHGCAILEDGRLRCWGSGRDGRLGLPGLGDVGDDERPLEVDPVMVARPMQRSSLVATGAAHACVVRDDGELVCWGNGEDGRLGVTLNEDVGDDEPPALTLPVAFGEGVVVDLALGGAHGCVRVEDDLRCWGANHHGQLGRATTESSARVQWVELPGRVTAMALGATHTCAVLDSEALYCWGRGDFGQLGYGDGEDVGDDELPVERGPASILAARVNPSH